MEHPVASASDSLLKNVASNIIIVLHIPNAQGSSDATANALLKVNSSSRSFLGPIKIEVLVKISQSNCQKFFLLTFLMMIILLLFSSLAPNFFSLEKPHCTLQILEKPQPPIMTTVFQFVIFLLFRSKNKKSSSESIEQWLHADRGSLIS